MRTLFARNKENIVDSTNCGAAVCVCLKLNALVSRLDIQYNNYMHVQCGQTAMWLCALCISCAVCAGLVDGTIKHSARTNQIKCWSFCALRHSLVVFICTRRRGCEPANSIFIKLNRLLARGGKLLHLFEYSTQLCATPPERPGMRKHELIMSLKWRLICGQTILQSGRGWGSN